MNKAKLISIFLTVIMSLQVIPIASIGRMLGSNQWTEELPHGCADDADRCDDAKIINFLLPEQHSLAIVFDTNQSLLRLHIAAGIPLNHSSEIVSPPPDQQFLA